MIIPSIYIVAHPTLNNTQLIALEAISQMLHEAASNMNAVVQKLGSIIQQDQIQQVVDMHVNELKITLMRVMGMARQVKNDPIDRVIESAFEMPDLAGLNSAKRSLEQWRDA